MDGAFRIIQKNNPKRCFETRRDSFLVGRAQKCDIIIDESHVSRVQAKVSFENGRHFIKNLGRNALRINGRTTAGDLLKPGDEITFGKTCFLYQAGVESAVESANEAKTVLASDSADTPLERRLVCTSPSGLAATHRLSQAKIVIGRSQEADIVLDDPSVSRSHCVIEARGDAYHIRNISSSNPLTINHEPANEKRLYSGDQLKIGDWSLAFVSSRRDDTRMQEQPHQRHPMRTRWVFALLFAVAAGYVAYGPVFVPWMEAQKAVHRIWLDYQKKEHQQQTVVQLLKEAEAHFAVKRYLTPIHQNAYSVYQAVLALDPQNETALKRIEQIRAYYRTEGDVHFKAGNWPKALAYLERYALIDPNAMDIREKITICHRKLAESPQSPSPSTPGSRGLKPAAPGEKEKVRQLLKESGTQSSWIMKYLFDESPRENDSKTPW